MSKPFSGNPAAVVPLASPRPDAVLPAIANESNLPETAFPRRLEDGSFGLRWFTPASKVALCGPATLAAAHALWQLGTVHQGGAIRFRTRSSGELVLTTAASA